MATQFYSLHERRRINFKTKYLNELTKGTFKTKFFFDIINKTKKIERLLHLMAVYFFVISVMLFWLETQKVRIKLFAKNVERE